MKAGSKDRIHGRMIGCLEQERVEQNPDTSGGRD